MKKPLFTLALVAASFAALAQQPTLAAPAPAASAASPYINMMAATIQELLTTNDPAATQQAISKFERAAAVMPADWLPRYYQAYGYVRLGFFAKDGEGQDKYFDQAQAALDQARKQPAADASELAVMQAYLYQGRIMVSPMTRAMQYTTKVGESLAQAEKLNPGNPRVYLVRGNDLNFRPKMFGGGPEAAKPYYDKAKACFDTFQPASSIAPTWGKGQLAGILKQYEATASK
ncbi:hypothetical protein [Hymenobacter sp.]|jgi:tetratricopeptide (TPR) repeat protein|uniref:hypothetical protein n=1 Tax=Hymenobacter sp. TaxID=1898978 RepID=UPI002ED9EFEB